MLFSNTRRKADLMEWNATPADNHLGTVHSVSQQQPFIQRFPVIDLIKSDTYFTLVDIDYKLVIQKWHAGKA